MRAVGRRRARSPEGDRDRGRGPPIQVDRATGPGERKIEAGLGVRVSSSCPRPVLPKWRSDFRVAQASGVRWMSLAPDLLKILVCQVQRAARAPDKRPAEALVVKPAPDARRFRGRTYPIMLNRRGENPSRRSSDAAGLTTKGYAA